MPLDVRRIEARYQPGRPAAEMGVEAVMLARMLHCQVLIRLHPEDTGAAIDGSMSPEWAAAAIRRAFPAPTA